VWVAGLSSAVLPPPWVRPPLRLLPPLWLLGAAVGRVVRWA